MEKITAILAAVTSTMAISIVAAYSPNTIQSIAREIPGIATKEKMEIVASLVMVAPVYGYLMLKRKDAEL